MSGAVPTAASIKMRFKEFASVDDAVIEFAIEEARVEFDPTTWTVGGDIALVYLCAHYVSASIEASASAGAGDEGQIASESIGRLSISYRSPDTGSATEKADASELETTSYGRRYMDLVRSNFSGPMVI